MQVLPGFNAHVASHPRINGELEVGNTLLNQLEQKYC